MDEPWNQGQVYVHYFLGGGLVDEIFDEWEKVYGGSRGDCVQIGYD